MCLKDGVGRAVCYTQLRWCYQVTVKIVQQTAALTAHSTHPQLWPVPKCEVTVECTDHVVAHNKTTAHHPTQPATQNTTCEATTPAARHTVIKATVMHATPAHHCPGDALGRQKGRQQPCCSSAQAPKVPPQLPDNSRKFELNNRAVLSSSHQCIEHTHNATHTTSVLDRRAAPKHTAPLLWPSGPPQQQQPQPCRPPRKRLQAGPAKCCKTVKQAGHLTSSCPMQVGGGVQAPHHHCLLGPRAPRCPCVPCVPRPQHLPGPQWLPSAQDHAPASRPGHR
jgi:hypothetical protein